MRTQKEQQSIAKARKAGLRYVHHLEDGWLRRRCGRGFIYFATGGRRLVAERTLKRIASLAIPPAWEDVRICPQANGHIQAIGRDAKGRLQYLYHDDWHEISAATKFDRLELVGQLLGKIRRRVRRDLAEPGLSKKRVVAAVVRLIDKAHLRVGNAAYVEENGSRGATTLAPEQVEVEGVRISLDFPGKGGRQTEAVLADGKVAAVVERCEEIDGQFLFCYCGDDGDYHPVSSSDVNGYLREVAGERLSAKDFRTWSASVIALGHLKTALPEWQTRSTKRLINEAVKKTAEEMGHTAAICRQSYVHPGLLAAFETGELAGLIAQYDKSAPSVRPELIRDEDQLLTLLPALSH